MIILNNLQEMHLKLLQKEKVKKQQEATDDLIRNKIADKTAKASQISPKNSQGTVTNKTFTNEYDKKILKKDIYISNK